MNQINKEETRITHRVTITNSILCWKPQGWMKLPSCRGKRRWARRCMERAGRLAGSPSSSPELGCCRPSSPSSRIKTPASSQNVRWEDEPPFVHSENIPRNTSGSRTRCLKHALLLLHGLLWSSRKAIYPHWRFPCDAVEKAEAPIWSTCSWQIGGDRSMAHGLCGLWLWASALTNSVLAGINQQGGSPFAGAVRAEIMQPHATKWPKGAWRVIKGKKKGNRSSTEETRPPRTRTRNQPNRRRSRGSTRSGREEPVNKPRNGQEPRNDPDLLQGRAGGGAARGEGALLHARRGDGDGEEARLHCFLPGELGRRCPGLAASTKGGEEESKAAG